MSTVISENWPLALWSATAGGISNRAFMLGLKISGWNVRPITDVLDRNLRHRIWGYQWLRGNGLELGAFNNPAALPPHCRVKYCDLMDKTEGLRRFPEMAQFDTVDVDYLIDFNKDNISPIPTESQDFVIMNHVIEHLANPIRMIKDLFRVVRPGGYVVISAPDKDFNPDINRPLTSFEHLVEEYHNNTSEVSDEHYRDYLRGVVPHRLTGAPDQEAAAILAARQRREHVHVWNSVTFRAFLQQTIELVLKIKTEPIFESLSANNKKEYFSVWRKLNSLNPKKQ